MEFYLSGNSDQELPFELQAFEVPLAAAVRLFEAETNALEGKLLPSLERLTAKVCMHTITNEPTNEAHACHNTGRSAHCVTCCGSSRCT